MNYIVKSTFAIGAYLCLLAASLNGCVAKPRPDFMPVPGPGTVDVNVTIDNDNDPLDCSYFLIDDIEIVLDDVTTLTTDCETHGVTFTNVPPGVHEVKVTLLAGGSTVGESWGDTVEVGSGEAASIDVDFASDSIAPPD